MRRRLGVSGSGRSSTSLDLYRGRGGLLLRRGPCVLYYPPAGPHIIPVLRDIVYLLAVRPLSRGAVFHYHAGGLPQYIAGLNPVVRALAKLAYRDALVSVEIAESEPSPSEAFNARRRILVPNGVDVSDPGVRIPPPGAPHRIFYMAGLRESKGVLDVLATAGILVGRGVDFHIDVAGAWQEESTRESFEGQLAASGFAGRVTMHGRVEGEDKWRLYRDASVFFFPSFYESENFPLVLIEAMAFGLPVVATRWRGIPQLVAEGETGALLDVHDIEGFAVEIEHLLTSPGRWEAMSSAARSRYGERYTEEAFLAGMRHVFETALGCSAKG